MARIFLCIPLLSALLGFAQQQPAPSQDPSAQPPSSSDSSQSNAQTKASANNRIQTSIQDLLDSDPVLNGTDVSASVDDHNIVLSGAVDSYAQHQRVLQLVAQYGQWRKIVDNVKSK